MLTNLEFISLFNFAPDKIKKFRIHLYRRFDLTPSTKPSDVTVSVIRIYSLIHDEIGPALVMLSQLPNIIYL